MLPTDFSAGFSSSGWFVLASLVLCIAAAWLFYRYTLPALPRRRRIAMSLLRAASLTLLAILLFEPVLRLVSRSYEPATVAVLVDDSQSMTIRDRTGEREEQIRKWLASSPLNGIPGSARLQFYRFSHSLRPLPEGAPPDSMEFRGETTDIAAAMASLGTRSAQENIRAVVLVSDGNYTIGRNPAYDAEALAVPVFTVGVGDTSDQKDLLVTRVFTNDVAYAGSVLPFEVTVKSSGFGGERVEVMLSEGTNTVDRKTMTLEEGVHEYRVQMRATPAEEGTRKYTVGVSQLDGELTVRNNSQSVYVRVLKSKLRMLIVAGAPSPDVSAVHRLLKEDPQFTVVESVQKRGGGWYGRPLDASAIDSADCIIVINFPTGSTPAQAVQLLAGAFERTKKPLLFVGGVDIDERKLRLFDAVLPFTVGAVGPLEMMVVPSVPDRYRMHQLIHLSDDLTVDDWRRLPPVFVRQSVVRAKPESEVLAAMMFQNVQMNDPLIAIRNVNRQKSVGIAGYGIWRWQLLAGGMRQKADLASEFLTTAVRWLTTQDEKKNLRVMPVKERFSSSEPVEFTAQVYDARMRPAGNADVTLELKKGNDVYAMAFTDIGNGRYEGSLPGVPEGDYTYSARATAGGQPLGEDRGAISVGQINVEYLETRMNKSLLEQIAFRTGGIYTGITSGENLGESVAATANLTAREHVESSELEIWNWSYMVPIIILLLSLEWFLRKRMGML